jgi:hypothetical protein
LTLKLSRSSVGGTAPAYQSPGTAGGHRSKSLLFWSNYPVSRLIVLNAGDLHNLLAINYLLYVKKRDEALANQDGAEVRTKFVSCA